MDCNSEVQIGYIFWDTTNAINLDFMIDGTNIEKYSCLTYTDPQILNGVDMTNPSSDIGFDKKWSEEKYLTMIIQMPSTITSAVLVLEGEYSKNRLLLDYSLPEIFNDENYVTSPSSLTTQSRSNSYAFNDRLLEYLLWNTITSQDKISKNTVRIQDAISSDICSQLNGYKIDRNDLDIGTWTANMKFFIYQRMLSRLSNQVIKLPFLILSIEYWNKRFLNILYKGTIQIMIARYYYKMLLVYSQYFH